MSEWIIIYTGPNMHSEKVTADYYRPDITSRLVEFKDADHKCLFAVALDLVQSIRRLDPEPPATVKIDTAVIRSEINKQVAKQGYTRR